MWDDELHIGTLINHTVFGDFQEKIIPLSEL
ncbi:hypothetical protein BGP_6186 [Beggiatoa sp. PS]|nr:hypothetical protein BGP_6186 [Beggiatoa sp. PS]